MSIERTGTTISIEIPYGSGYREGNQSIEVPSDAVIAIATYCAYYQATDWYNNPMFTIGAAAFTQECRGIYSGSGNTAALAIEYLANPATGTQTFYWDISDTANPYYGGIVHIVFYKGVDTTDPVKDSDVNQSGNDITGMDYAAGDMMFGCAISFNTSIAVTGSGQTQIVNPDAYRNTRAACAEKLSTGAFDTTGGQDQAAAAIILTELSVTRNTSAGLGLDETVGGAINGWGSVSGDCGFDEIVHGAINGWGSVESGLGLSETIGANRETTKGIAPGIGFAEVIVGKIEVVRGISEGLGLEGSTGISNFSQWLADNADHAVYRYYASITGIADGVADYAISGLKSFQFRLRSGEASYLGLSITYDYDDLTAIEARSNGQIVIDMAAVVNGVESLREELIRVDLHSVRYDRGGNSQSISLVGYRTQTYGADAIDLIGVTKETMLADGRLYYRCARPDFYLKPGNIASYGANTFEVGTIMCSVSPISQYMDVTEVSA